ncbi:MULTISPECIES: hypothetical protein [unclassified Streptomyces]|uniref:Uncharacterized protein n=1 Tax=Streptomyces millisiae TaxID=3075542 RepID=A0ABU2LYH0_9ACTN|nr:hypothetical protein [Streptomyces sp. DSM 44918]MDT0322642.1 hypothetical protein [Streptomyces sp. DSM 44918]
MDATLPMTTVTRPRSADDSALTRARAAARAARDTTRRRAAVALQRALDRRDNGAEFDED